MKMRCNGCGVRMECQPRSDDPNMCDLFHPDPLCSHVINLLAAGAAAGPVTRGRLDLDTGEIIEDPAGPS